MGNQKRVGILLAMTCLGALALFTFHVISRLLFAVLGIAPSSPNWLFVPILGGVLAIAGAGVGVLSFKLPRIGSWFGGVAAAVAAGAVLGFFSAGELTGQALQGAAIGAVGGGIVLGLIGGWAFGSKPGKIRGFFQMAIALMGSFCAYGVAFGLGAWSLAAVTTGRWGLAILLGPPSLTYFWLTKRAIGWIYWQGLQLWR